MKTTAFLIIVAVLLGLGWIRFAPSDPDLWHVDPADAEFNPNTGWRMIGREAPRFPGDPDTILSEFADIALSAPRVRLLDGDIAEGMMTFVARSKVFGFPDYVTVKAVAEGAQTKLSVISRARYAGSDWGVNRARLDTWLGELQLRLAQ